MKPDSFISVALFAVGASGGLLPQDHEVVQEFITSLKSDPRFDWDRPPSMDTYSESEPTEWPWTLKCNPTYFKIQKQMTPPPPSSGRVKSPEIDIYFVPYVERAIINFGDMDITLNAEQTTTSIHSTTAGWQVGAQLMSGSKGIGISSGYSDSWTDGVYRTKALSIQSTCKPGYECRIETWTFHIKISGDCKLRPFINCDGEADACLNIWTPHIAQFDEFTKKHCLPSHPNGPYRYEPCEVNTPLLDEAGQPFTRLVHIAQSIRTAREPAIEAIREEDGWYLLSNGEWYDPRDNTYYGGRDDHWYTKPEAAKPDLSEFPKVPKSATKDSQRARLAETKTREERPGVDLSSSPDFSRFVDLPGVAKILSKRSGRSRNIAQWKGDTGRPVLEVKFLDTYPKVSKTD